jgi:hypothetical protein
MLIRLLAGVFHSTITVLIVGFVILVGFAAATATAYGDPKHLMALAVIGVAFFVIVFLFGPILVLLDMRTAMLEIAEAARNSTKRIESYEHTRREPSFRQNAA